jgi:queuine tRNA-ribosyltransferase
MKHFFSLDHRSKKSRARAGRLTTSHGVVHTPFFMPIATRGAVRHVSPQELRQAGAEIILSNTYHLFLEPGQETLDIFGGLHNFMGWPRPILTDSGGYQVFSLGEKSAGRAFTGGLEAITDDGVVFRSPKSGTRHTFTPERVIDIQWSIGSDIMMVLDECVGNPCAKPRARAAVDRTYKWAIRSLVHMEERRAAQEIFSAASEHHLFAINQGSVYPELRKRSAKQLTAHDFDGFAIGGLAVGEARADLLRMVALVAPMLPKEKPRYLMGVGEPEELVASVMRGVDMFDCVIPTRNARHGRLYTWKRNWRAALLSGKQFYHRVNIRNASFAHDRSPLDSLSTARSSREIPRAYLRHLLRTNEGLGARLASVNNIAFYVSLMQRLRAMILDGDL